MRKSIGILYVTAAACVSVVSSAHAVDAKTEREVKDAAMLGIRAWRECDAKALRELATPIENGFWAQVQLCLEEDREHNRLTREVHKHFPKEASGEWPDGLLENELKDLQKRMDESPLTATGEIATIAIKRWCEIELQKQDGKWRWNAVKFFQEREHIDREGWEDRTRYCTKAYGEIADRVAKGEFKNTWDIQLAMDKAGLIAISRPLPPAQPAK